MEDMFFGAGCTPSVMDGTEHIYEIDESVELPEEFSWQFCMPPVRNQGMTQTCVCQSLTCVLDYLRNSKTGTTGVCNNFNVNELYNARTNKPQEGMSFKDALSYLRHHGLNGEKINSYAKITSVDSCKHALLMFGPVVAGFPVYGNGSRFWKKNPVCNYGGGHAIVICGYTKDGFIVRNSWGENWGSNPGKGYQYMSYEDFDNCCFEAWTVTI